MSVRKAILIIGLSLAVFQFHYMQNFYCGSNNSNQEYQTVYSLLSRSLSFNSISLRIASAVPSSPSKELFKHAS